MFLYMTQPRGGFHVQSIDTVCLETAIYLDYNMPDRRVTLVMISGLFIWSDIYGLHTSLRALCLYVCMYARCVYPFLGIQLHKRQINIGEDNR